MLIKTFERLRSRIAGFRSAKGGNVTVIFALATLPIVGFVGAAVDYSHANSIKAAMQAALDSTALMLSKDAATLSPSQLQAKADTYFKALLNRPEVGAITVTASYTTSGGSKVVLGANTTMQTNFMKVMGFPSLNIGVNSTTAWGSAKLRVALALDNTGSMSSAGKMTALKTATKSLLTTLQNASATQGDVYVAIVPFAKDVNVGSSNRDANWIDWSDWEDDNGRWVTSTTCSGGYSRRGRSRCTSTQSWVPDSHTTWNGCITDRDQDYDLKNTSPNPADVNLSGSTPSTLFPAEQYNACPAKIMGQTYDWTALNNLVDDMQPNGGTNQPIGLAWAWMALTDGAPLNPPAIADPANTQKVIILLSDGLNTQDRWYGNGSTPSSQVDDRMSKLCTNIKAAKITIYTIQVNTDGDPVSSVLKNCATDNEKFFYSASASGIGTAFQAIGTNLAKLRIAK